MGKTRLQGAEEVQIGGEWGRLSRARAVSKERGQQLDGDVQFEEVCVRKAETLTSYMTRGRGERARRGVESQIGPRP